MLKNTNKVVKHKSFDTQHAIVIGGGMAGLLAARVLSEHFDRVTILERDPLLDDAEPRKGVPQGRHVHVLLAGGAAVLGAYFPDLFATLAQDGAEMVGPSDFRSTSSVYGWHQFQVMPKHLRKADHFLNTMSAPV